MVGLELKLQRVIFLLTFQGQMRVLAVRPLFIWECRWNLAIRTDEMLGVGRRRGGGEARCSPQAAPRGSFDW